MNRKQRRAAAATQRPGIQVTCNVCRVQFFNKPRAPDSAVQAARAFRQHCRVTGCVKLEDIDPVTLPDIASATAVRLTPELPVADQGPIGMPG